MDNNQAFAGGFTPPVRPQGPEDIFAPVDKGQSAGQTGQPAAASYNQVPRPAPYLSRPQAPSLPSQQPMSTVMPAATGGSMKYLIIGLITLVLVLGAGLAVYQFILKPQFDATPTPTPTTVNQPETIQPAAPPVEAAPATTTESFATSTPAKDSVTAAAATTTASTIDTDGDGLIDSEEVSVYHSSPTKADTDGDGLTDSEEVRLYHTDPNDADTDADGYKDGVEVKGGYNPVGQGRLSVVK